MKLLSIALALACTNIEPIHDYHKMKVEDQKWGLDRHVTFGLVGRDCTRISAGTSVEVLEKNEAYPFILKLRYSDPDKLIYNEKGEIAGKGVTYDAYADASEFATDMPKPVFPKIPQKVVEQRKRNEAVKKEWGIPGDTVFIGD